MTALSVGALGLALFAAGCASVPSAPLHGGLAPAAERGRQVAERDCAACHAIGASSQSPSGMAPPFRVLRMRYNPISLERHIGDLTARGYFAMPPQPVSQDDAEAVAAYIETLR